MNNSIDFFLSVQNDRADADELRSVLVNLTTELDRFSADVTEVPAAEAVATGMIPKGDEKGNLLAVKINLDSLKNFAKWLYDRLVGTMTKARFDFEKFVIEIAAKKPKNERIVHV